MVRKKNRWLTLKVEFEGGTADCEVTRNELSASIRSTVMTNGGDVSSTFLHDVRVYFYDDNVGIGLVRVPRHGYATTRAAITCITRLKQQRVSIDTLHVSGSGRTAKLVMAKKLPKIYDRLLSDNNTSADETERYRKGLEDSLALVKEIMN